MTDPKKPAKRPARFQSIALDAPPPALTHAELALLNAYRVINDRQQQNMLRAMESAAVRFPRAPRLRLVSGGSA